MLAQCRTHGYYRGDTCPICSSPGRIMMKDHEVDSIGRMMAGVLRHFPERFNLSMDGRGWVDLDQFVEAIRRARPQTSRWLRREHIEALVETDDKGRYQIDGGMVRATYAHSVPVNLDDLPECHLDQLYFPVAEEELDMVLESGLRPADRNMIHLSGTPEKAFSAGRVHMPEPILLEVDVKGSSKAGNFIFRAGKDVYVTEAVEPEFVKKFEDADQIAMLREKYKDMVNPTEQRLKEREARDAARDAQRRERDEQRARERDAAPKAESSSDDVKQPMDEE